MCITWNGSGLKVKLKRAHKSEKAWYCSHTCTHHSFIYFCLRFFHVLLIYHQIRPNQICLALTARQPCNEGPRSCRIDTFTAQRVGTASAANEVRLEPFIWAEYHDRGLSFTNGSSGDSVTGCCDRINQIISAQHRDFFYRVLTSGTVVKSK